MEFQRQRLHDLNVLYKEKESLIDSVQSGLRREIPLLIQEFKPSVEQTAALDEYINDRGTMTTITHCASILTGRDDA